MLVAKADLLLYRPECLKASVQRKRINLDGTELTPDAGADVRSTSFQTMFAECKRKLGSALQQITIPAEPTLCSTQWCRTAPAKHYGRVRLHHPGSAQRQSPD